MWPRSRCPDDWQIFYFGCQHLETPRPVSHGLVRVTRALDTHAVAFRASAYREVRKIMRGHRRGRGAAEQFNDVLLSTLHKKLPTYAAFPNLIWQALGRPTSPGHTYSNYTPDGHQQPFQHVLSSLIENGAFEEKASSPRPASQQCLRAGPWNMGK